jgi:hypothetical protein
MTYNIAQDGTKNIMTVDVCDDKCRAALAGGGLDAGCGTHIKLIANIVERKNSTPF